MKIALIGYGAMGRLVESRAGNEGCEVALRVTSREAAQSAEELSRKLCGMDVAVDFSIGSAVFRNISACAQAGVPLVEGTTGWGAQEPDARRLMAEKNGALLYGANFSIGVNVFYRIVSRAAELFQAVEAYAAFIEEAHHARKRDAPSGTALRLCQIVAERLGREVPVASTRAGYIPGTHRVGFDSIADQITLTHMARSREGFAAGALLGARWICGRKGVYEFSETLDEILKSLS